MSKPLLFFCFPLSFFLLTISNLSFAQVSAHNSFDKLVTSNGMGASVFNVTEKKINMFYPHIYRFFKQDTQTPQLCYDAYFGLRIDGSGNWLNEQTINEINYINGTGIITSKQRIGDINITTNYWAPMTFKIPSLIMNIKILNNSNRTHNVSGYSLFNFHLGTGSPDPQYLNEQITWQDNCWIESGDGATIAYCPIENYTHRSSSPDNPYLLLQNGQNLTDNSGTGGPYDDAVAGFQTDWGDIGELEEKSWSVAILYIDGGINNASNVIKSFNDWIGSRDSDTILQDEQTYWNDWHSLEYQLNKADEKQKSLWRQSTAFLKMGQVEEQGTGNGQILASLPPGQWNIAWVRDMSYAILALIKSGHLDEAKAGIKFFLNAGPGTYTDYVGKNYRISITRYYGNGQEESDWNENGPNIEFDGFGLFLWVLNEYLSITQDQEILSYWNMIKEEIADVLVSLIEQDSGLIKADSSIWEVHWNSQQKHFTYTDITAIQGLNGASQIAQITGDNSSIYLEAAQKIKTSLLSKLVSTSNILVQSLEEYSQGDGYYDAAVVEAIAFDVIDPLGDISKSTLNNFLQNLSPPSKRGFFRNDDGGWYDNQEWIVIDLLSSIAFRKAGDETKSDELINWITDQSALNYNIIAELYDANNADYQGAIPMLGFGAGVYILALLEKEKETPLEDGGIFDTEFDTEEDISNDIIAEDTNVSDLDNEDYLDVQLDDLEEFDSDIEDADIDNNAKPSCGCRVVQ